MGSGSPESLMESGPGNSGPIHVIVLVGPKSTTKQERKGRIIDAAYKWFPPLFPSTFPISYPPFLAFASDGPRFFKKVRSSSKLLCSLRHRRLENAQEIAGDVQGSEQKIPRTFFPRTGPLYSIPRRHRRSFSVSRAAVHVLGCKRARARVRNGSRYPQETGNLSTAVFVSSSSSGKYGRTSANARGCRIASTWPREWQKSLDS
jgi:hypothetical protein